MRILVIEDILASRLVVRRTLVLAGHDVLLAETGEEGLEQAVTATPDASRIFRGGEACTRNARMTMR